MAMKISEKVRRWGLFSVVGSCFPLFLNLIGPMAVGSSFPGIVPITEHGDLYLVGAALCAAALGELFGVTDVKKEVKQYAGAAGAGSLVSCAFLYAYSSTNTVGLKTGQAISVQVVTVIISILSSIACIAASEAR